MSEDEHRAIEDMVRKMHQVKNSGAGQEPGRQVIPCPQCAKKLAVTARPGTVLQVNCPSCGHSFHWQAAEAVEAEPATTPSAYPGTESHVEEHQSGLGLMIVALCTAVTFWLAFAEPIPAGELPGWANVAIAIGGIAFIYLFLLGFRKLGAGWVGAFFGMAALSVGAVLAADQFAGGEGVEDAAEVLASEDGLLETSDASETEVAGASPDAEELLAESEEPAMAGPNESLPGVEETLAYIVSRCDGENNYRFPQGPSYPRFNFSSDPPDAWDYHFSFDIREVTIRNDGYLDCPANCIVEEVFYDGDLWSQYNRSQVGLMCRDNAAVVRAMRHLQDMAGGQVADPFAQ